MDQTAGTEPGWLPLTMGQADFWQEYLQQPDDPVSTVAHGIRIRGQVQPNALVQAITQTVAESDVLSLRFSLGSSPAQRVDPADRPQLVVRDLRDHAEPRTEAQRLIDADVAAVLNLCTGPISAQWLLRIADDEWLWYCRGHHIILDGYAMALIERRCAALYSQAVGGEAAGPAFGRLADVVAEEHAYRESAAWRKDAAFWQGQSITDLSVIDKGAEDYPNEPLHEMLDLSPMRDGLLHLSERMSLGWPDLLTLLSGLWLWHAPPVKGATPQQPRTIWLPYMSRMGSVSAMVPAMVVNILPFQVDAAPERTLDETLRSLATSLRRMRRHGRYRIEQLALDRGLGPNRRYFFSPLINVMPFDPPIFSGCKTQREVLAAGPGDGLNFSFAANGRADDLVLHIEADPRLTPRPLFDRHCAGFVTFMRRGLAAPDQPSEVLLCDL